VVSGSITVSASASIAFTTASGISVESTIDLTQYEPGKQYKVVLTGSIECWYFTFEENTDPREKYPFVVIDPSTLKVILVNDD